MMEIYVLDLYIYIYTHYSIVFYLGNVLTWSCWSCADFTSEELESLIKAGAVPVGLGQRRLRVETAAIAILSTVMLMEDGVSSDS